MVFRVIIILFLLVSTLIIASEIRAEDDKDQLIDELYIKSGYEEQVKNLPESFKLTLDQQSHFIDKSEGKLKEYFENVNDLIVKSLDPTVLGSGIKADLKKELSIKEIKHMLIFLDTPIGKKATKLEVRSSSAQGIKDFSNYLVNASSNAIPEPRKSLLIKLENLLNTLEYTTEMNINIQIAATSAMAFSIESNDVIDFEYIARTLKESKPRMKKELAPLVHHFLYFTYKDLSDEELRELIQFYDDETSQRLMKAISESYVNAVTNGSINFSQSVLDFFNNNIKNEPV